ncbi:AAA family ATPase [Thermodesulfobacteriota bacterium]
MIKYIITGGPHSGKSSVLDLIKEKGFTVLHETARLMIREDQEKKQSDPAYNFLYPWEDQRIFCHRCHERQLEREKELTGEMAILDRSIIDNLAYAAVAGIELDKKIYRDISEAGYEKKVFYFEQLKDYVTDDQRKDSEKQVKAVHKEIYNIYIQLGFELITIPVFSDDKKINIMKRAEIILGHIKP